MDNYIAKDGYDKFIIKVNAIDTKIPSTSRLVTKTQYDSDKEGRDKKIEDVDQKIPITSGVIKKMTTAQKLQRLKTRYLMLLDEWIQKPQRLKTKNTILLILLQRLLCIHKVEEIEVKYLILLNKYKSNIGWKQILDTTSFITTSKSNRLPKLSFHARMKGAVKNARFFKVLKVK